MPTGYSFRSSILRYLCPTKSFFFENFWWRHCMWFVVWAPSIKNPGYAYDFNPLVTLVWRSLHRGSIPLFRSQLSSSVWRRVDTMQDIFWEWTQSNSLFGRGRLKITMKRYTACCVCQYCTSNSCPCAAKFETAGCRSHASGLGKKKLCK